jgi:hypothetical protein
MCQIQSERNLIRKVGRGCRRYMNVAQPSEGKYLMMRYRLFAATTAGLVALAASVGAASAAVTEDNFISRTSGDLAALCSAAPTDKLYTAAVNFCYGFGAGAYGVLAEVQQADPNLKLFCMPQNMTRSQAVAAFVSWAGAKPERAALPAIDGVTAFLTDSYAAPSRRTQ